MGIDRSENWIWAVRANDPSNVQAEFPYQYEGNVQNDGDLNGHGSCVLSKAVGPSYGVSKNADITVVRIQPTIFGNNDLVCTDPSQVMRINLIIDALTKVLADITKKILGQRAVVNPSCATTKQRNTGFPLPTDGGIYQLYIVIKQLNAADIVVVTITGAGNGGTIPTDSDSDSDDSDSEHGGIPVSIERWADGFQN